MKRAHTLEQIKGAFWTAFCPDEVGWFDKSTADLWGSIFEELEKGAGFGTVWVVGRSPGGLSPWEVQGIYTDEQRAIEACTEMNFFVGPVELDAAFPVETVTWPGCYYPQSQEATDEPT